MKPNHFELISTFLFAIAILHTFVATKINRFSQSLKKNSFARSATHLLGEVELVFGLWALVLLCYFAFYESPLFSWNYLVSRNFQEPLLVFTLLLICSTRPTLMAAEKLLLYLARRIPLPRTMSFYMTCLVIGPLLGSVITEPAAMTIVALLLKDSIFDKSQNAKFKYATLGLLFVNISIGGTLTHFAAPPVVMVAKTWGWDLSFMLMQFGPSAILAILNSTILYAFVFRRDLAQIPAPTIGNSHFPKGLRWKESFLVAFFLAGLVVFGEPQRWWIEPLLTSHSYQFTFLGTTLLTAITDNAALTYLGAQVPNLSDIVKYSLVAGAVTGGGLTVIANAPNPAGYSILGSSFGKDGISPLGLLAGALPPTIITMILFFPH